MVSHKGDLVPTQQLRGGSSSSSSSSNNNIHHYHEQHDSKAKAKGGGGGAVLGALFRVKPSDDVRARATSSMTADTMKRCLTVKDLIPIGVGSTVGAGVYVLVGTAARDRAGPALTISFLIAGIAAALAALCYAELASRCPSAGSAYHYAYTCVGEVVAWLIGWSLILEYAVGASAVARGLSPNLGVFVGGEENIPYWLARLKLPYCGGIVADPLAAIAVLLVTVLLCVGIKESVQVQTIMVLVNVTVLGFVVIAGVWAGCRSGWIGYKQAGGYFPYGVNGVLGGAAMVFFSYIGFDTVASTAEEVKRPQRDLPLGIGLSLLLCGGLYMSIAVVLLGLVPYDQISRETPITTAFEEYGMPVVKYMVASGALAALSTSLLGGLLPQPRVLFAMARDGLLPNWVGELTTNGTPLNATILTGVFASVLAFCMDITTLSNMVSVGTLLAFTCVSASVLIVRYAAPPVEACMTPTTGAVDVVPAVLTASAFLPSSSSSAARQASKSTVSEGSAAAAEAGEKAPLLQRGSAARDAEDENRGALLSTQQQERSFLADANPTREKASSLSSHPDGEGRGVGGGGVVVGGGSDRKNKRPAGPDGNPINVRVPSASLPAKGAAAAATTAGGLLDTLKVREGSSGGATAAGGGEGHRHHQGSNYGVKCSIVSDKQDTERPESPGSLDDHLASPLLGQSLPPTTFSPPPPARSGKWLEKETEPRRRQVAIVSISAICIGAPLIATAAAGDLLPFFIRMALLVIGAPVLGAGFIFLSVMREDEASLIFGHPGGFRCPFVPALPVASIVVNTYLMINLGLGTWKRVSLWLAIGALLYVFYGFEHSKLRLASMAASGRREKTKKSTAGGGAVGAADLETGWRTRFQRSLRSWKRCCGRRDNT
ncbi:hypothetical protein CBR_g61206 [Chara braunii]|uniref:Cationic amino acid transporter C-terminal domain-containing protein n=1 Tax=Chara braunii TaxID=69332 RepID=A0A388MFA0_CHABU|nr:hypothetical protein CBR_g61206 [Chara braunii]|eukprot:GBG93231.1 hypothetical protein CBR_g61206 [Chara braunii]